MIASNTITAPNYTQIPNAVLDHWSLQLSHKSYILLLIFCRRIFGYSSQRDSLSVQLSYKDLERLSGFSRKTLTEATVELEKHNLIKVNRSLDTDGSPNPNLYSLIVQKETTQGLEPVYLPQHTQVPNCVLDTWISVLKKTEIMVYLCLIRHTIGYHKTQDLMSYDQLSKKTGLTVNSVQRVIASLCAMGLVKKTNTFHKSGDYNPNTYEIVFKVAPSKDAPKRGLHRKNYPRGVGEKMGKPVGEKLGIPNQGYKDINKTPTKEKITKENNTPKPPHSEIAQPEAKQEVLFSFSNQDQKKSSEMPFKKPAQNVHFHPELDGLNLTYHQQLEFASYSPEQISQALAVLKEAPSVRSAYHFLKAALEKGWKLDSPEERVKNNAAYARKICFEHQDVLAGLDIQLYLGPTYCELTYLKSVTPQDNTITLDDPKFKEKIDAKIDKYTEVYRKITKKRALEQQKCL